MKTTEAELALQRKYELLRKKKEQAAKGNVDTAKTQPAANRPKQTLAPTQAGGYAKRPNPGALQAPSTATVPTTKIKVIITKRQTSPEASKPTTKSKPADTTATVKPAVAQQQPTKKEPEKKVYKKPQIRRPRPQPESQPTTATQPQPPLQQQQQQTQLPEQQQPEAKRLKANDDAPVAVAPQQPVEQQQQHYESNEAAAAAYYQQEQQQPTISEPRLLVQNLPQHYTTDMLWQLFSSNFGNVVDAQVVVGYSYGFVTMGSFEEAQDLLDFQQHQPIEIEDRQLRLSWASDADAQQGYDAGGGGGGEGMVDSFGHYPKRSVAESMAQQIAQHIDERGAIMRPPERDVVTYDDL